MKYIILMISLCIATSGCKERTGIEKEVMDIHDEVMPRLGELNKDRKKLQQILKSTDDDVTKKILLDAISNLEDADEGMMVWMSEWSVPAEDPEKTEYLKGEMVRIQKVKNDMLSSMSAAKELAKKYGR